MLKRCFLFAAGDSGEGMTGGTIAGIVISNLILNRPHPWIDVYSPTRFPAVTTVILSQAVTEIQENLEVSLLSVSVGSIFERCNMYSTFDFLKFCIPANI